MIAPRLFAPKRPRPRRVTLIKREPDRIGTGPAIMGFIFLAVALGYAALGRTHPPDPYLGKARRMIERYEAGRPEAARDYESDAYLEALKTLELVSGTPQESAEARGLAIEIQGKMAVQRTRQRLRGREILATQEARQRRDKAFMEETRRTTIRADDDDDPPAGTTRSQSEFDLAPIEGALPSDSAVEENEEPAFPEPRPSPTGPDETSAPPPASTAPKTDGAISDPPDRHRTQRM